MMFTNFYEMLASGHWPSFILMKSTLEVIEVTPICFVIKEINLSGVREVDLCLGIFLYHHQSIPGEK